VAGTVQIFGHFRAGKSARYEIAVDLNLVRISNAGDLTTRSTILHFDVRQWPVEAKQLPQDASAVIVGYLHRGHHNSGNQSSPKHILDATRGIRWIKS
jgi:curli biogenesis system outer membrane secretion channel CsgG